MAFAPPILATKFITPPMAKTWRIIPAFHGSAKAAIALSTKSKNELNKAENTFIPFKLSKKPPDITPRTRDTITFLVTKAKTIATNGGSIVSTPNFSAFTVAISVSAAKADTLDIINNIVVIKNNLAFFLFILFSPYNYLWIFRALLFLIIKKTLIKLIKV